MKKLLEPRLLAWHLLVLLVAALFIQLGFWQLARHGQLLDRNAVLEARVTAPADAYQAVITGLNPDAPLGAQDDAYYRPVTLQGTFLPEHEVLLRGRAYQERPGFHVLTPLVPDVPLSGYDPETLVLVNRGWVPFEYENPNLPDWSAPEGTVTVTGWLEPEADDPVGPLAMFAPRDPAEGPLERIARPDVERLAPQMPGPLAPFLVTAGALRTADGATREATDFGADGWVVLPVLASQPEPEGGPHFSYALQWWSFALIGVVGYAFLLRGRRAEPN